MKIVLAPAFFNNGSRYLTRINQAVNLLDDQFLELGTDQDGVLTLSSAAVTADTEVTGLIEGTSDHIGHAANSVVLSNITNDGDIHILVSKGGNSHTAFLADGSTGDTILNAASGQSVDIYVAGTKEIDYSAGALAFQQSTTISAASGSLTVSTATTATADFTFNDNVKVTLGTGGDADLYYDGTNVILLPRVVGSGDVYLRLGVASSTSGLVLDQTDTGGYGMALTFRTGLSGGYNQARINTETSVNGGSLFFNTANSSNSLTRALTIDKAQKAAFAGEVEIDGDFNHDGTNFGACGAAPQAQQATIVDADGTLADITTKFNTLLADIEGFGFLATS